MLSNTAVRGLATVLATYVAALLVGFLVLQQILLSLLIATALLLVGAFAYLAWRLLRGPSGPQRSRTL